jgi:hemerythrin-like domain-containing protein
MTTPSITEYFAKDHDRLDDLFVRFQDLKRKNFAAAKDHFKRFLAGLQRHIVWEEDILFPIFERNAGMHGGGPTAVMRVEHRQIREYLDAIHDKVRAGSPESDEAERDLLEVLSAHNRKEESILYPTIDSTLAPAERSAVFEQMEKVPAERFEKCCA